jgi:hypothetical protein
VSRCVGRGNPVTGESAHRPGSTVRFDQRTSPQSRLATRQRRAAARTSTQHSHGEFASGAVAFAVDAAAGERAGRSAAPARPSDQLLLTPHTISHAAPSIRSPDCQQPQSVLDPYQLDVRHRAEILRMQRQPVVRRHSRCQPILDYAVHRVRPHTGFASARLC